MEFRARLLFFFLLVAGTAVATAGAAAPRHAPLKRSSFPPGFLFGTASASYQYGRSRRGRWSRAKHLGHLHFSTSRENCRQEQREDRRRLLSSIQGRCRPHEGNGYGCIQVLNFLDQDTTEWKLKWGINKEGIAYYNHLIDELISKGLQPFVTMFHWDSPQGLEDLYGGFRSSNIVKDFVNYADILFREFGDRVKHWITFNEPWSFSVGGYSLGTFAPGRCSPYEAGKCSAGDSSREPYIVAHHQLLAHAATVKLYREKYQVSQKGIIGITIVSHWFVPFHNTKPDAEAAGRALDFMLGWFLDPLTQGDYPFSMRALLGDRLPKFTEQQSKMIKGSYDFIGLNYYTTNYAVAIPFTSKPVNKSYSNDAFATLAGSFKGKAIGPKAASSWLYIYPPGIRELLLYTRKKYNNPLIYITENGVDEFNNGSLTLKEALKDDMRIAYYQQHLQQLQQAIREGVNVKGYFAWSLLDNFEWVNGYTVRFGIYYVDYKNGLKRYPKSSVFWFRKLLKG